uniref:Methyltransferase domain-containing protein n=1 Tax=Chlamydomonas leiostraca TaxID=1034604 RepID=A0A7S0WQ03_9CHLO|mmetsp:Transcript_22885/g.58358  ORF Transcript_22885/g.58358 Transcript_22885/m.58358 type:complete len:192 (+) Transcript_22885:223-798(+)|eukprot:CAMPEP_0202881224 /NCGR_PEP_ID=MMETSP1391-20130828/36235_1 /ASSEMBLY_ACC=CAM_ASM_000867 /TAXON_ID=1034604 /ORGANISM="Chlamydomonas leiostraca, Strain SAG 11-49" /LENGTH=191 /DNA_ID=CAMNT_0049563877 /DNA_START=213 /DNA_END=788 /DNA_ORIENTATION=+
MAGQQGVVRSLLFEMKFWARYLLPTKYVAVYYPSPPFVVDRMMSLTGCSSKDTVFDLGSGDGRVLVAAAKLGARAVGYELDAQLVQTANDAIKAARVQELCRVIRGDAGKADVSTATIICIYLSDRGNATLMEAVRPTLQPGTKVVSNFFEVKGWGGHLLKTCTADPTTGPLYLYSAPGTAGSEQQDRGGL